jgi:hypothetical protein
LTTSDTVFWNSRYSVHTSPFQSVAIAYSPTVSGYRWMTVSKSSTTMAAAVPKAPSSRYIDDSTR